MMPRHPVFLIGLELADDGDLCAQLRVIVGVGKITLRHELHTLGAAGGGVELAELLCAKGYIERR